MSQKIVINCDYGGFCLSQACLKEMAKRQGKEIYFFTNPHISNTYVPLEESPEEERCVVIAFDVPNPNDYDPDDLWEKHHIDDSPSDRDNELLIQVVEELGADVCSGRVSTLRIVEIPDDVSWVIEEYDGLEWVAEDHRVWR